jgi:hypothetical protein
VTEGLTIQGSVSYNDDTESAVPSLIDNIKGTAAFGQPITTATPKGGVPGPFPNPFGVLGGVPAFSPAWQANVRARYEWQVYNYDAFAQIGASYIGDEFNQPASYPSGVGVLIPSTTFLRYLQPGYATVEASAGISKDKWSAELFGSNLTNSHASTFTSSAQFIKSEVPLRPLVVGLKLGYKF